MLSKSSIMHHVSKLGTECYILRVRTVDSASTPLITHSRKLDGEWRVCRVEQDVDGRGGTTGTLISRFSS